MDSMEYLKKYREKKKLSFGEMAKKTGVTRGYWPSLLEANYPPTIEKADQIATKTDMDRDLFINLVFRDRMLKFLEKEGLNDHNSTMEIQKIIEVFKKWNPEKETFLDVIGYIMSTNSIEKSLTIPNLACILYGLRKASDLTDKNFLRGRGKKEGGGEKRGFALKDKLANCFGRFAEDEVIPVQS